MSTNENNDKTPGPDFIRLAVIKDLETKRVNKVLTRFPPEPNGWLHIGHAKAICISFDIAKEFNGQTNLRFDDTNPEKEDMSYVEAIRRDIAWLGYTPVAEFFASDYYEILYELALKIIKKGLAYVDDLNDEEMREYRGTNIIDKNNITVTPPGRNSPHRDRSVEENLKLFAAMRAGKFKDGEKTLRAKIDMAHPNLVMRDPVMYRIRHVPHYRTGSKWCIYPMYDFQHPLSDALEGITHSLCSLEYEIHRPLYDWFINAAEVFTSRQIEFARLNISYTVLSKRWLLQLVQEKIVEGWDDPRMPTIAGLRRRGYSKEALHDFMSRIGIAKTNSMVDIQLLEHCIREDLNKRATRVLAVLKPLKLIIDNWPADKFEELTAVNNPEDENAGTRSIYFGRELYIEADDFAENPPPKYYRLYLGNSVRLRYGYVVTCTGFDKDAVGNITAVHCTYNPETRSGADTAANAQKVKGTIHWLSVKHAQPITVRLYDHLFTRENPMDIEPGLDWLSTVNKESCVTVTGFGETRLAEAIEYEHFQFERLGYFNCDPSSTSTHKVFNRTVSLRDTWAKIEKKN